MGVGGWGVGLGCSSKDALHGVALAGHLLSVHDEFALWLGDDIVPLKGFLAAGIPAHVCQVILHTHTYTHMPRLLRWLTGLTISAGTLHLLSCTKKSSNIIYTDELLQHRYI